MRLDWQGHVRAFALDGAGAEGFIADELTGHLAAATGVSTPRPAPVHALREAPAPAVALAIDPGLGRESFACAVEDGRLLLRGGDPRGLYYAVLAFLEQLGFRWYAPGEAGSVVPRLETIEIPGDWQARGAPDIPWRGFHICGSGWTRTGQCVGHFDYETALWMTRNRLDFKPIHNDEADEATPWLQALLLEPLAFGHSYSGWLPAELFDAHPEFFPLIGGRRQPAGQCCIANPGLFRQFIERIRAFADAHPELPQISIAPNDGYKFCQCPDCLALDTADDRARGELNRRQHRFAADLARAFAQTHPRQRLCTIAYSNYLEPAADIPREDHLAVAICVQRAQNRALDDPASPSNRRVLERFDRWLDQAGAVFWSGYDLSYGGTFPRPYARPLVRTLRVLAERKVLGFKTEVQPGRFARWQSAVFHLYLLARAAFDTDTDPDRLCDEFCRLYYGPAGAACRRYYRIHEAVVARYPEDLPAIDADTMPRLYGDGDVVGMQEALREAEAALVARDPVYVRRLEPLRRQMEEILATRTAMMACVAESAPLAAGRMANPPAFSDFERLDWRPMRMRNNRLPYPTPGNLAVVWTDDALHLCFRLEEPDMIRGTVREGLRAGVWGHSLVDCFLSPEPSSGVYFQVAANVLGESYAARCRGREWDMADALAPSLQLRLRTTGWDLMLGLSWEQLGMRRPSPGGRIRLALNRGQICQSPTTLGGWPNGGSWHQLDTMGEAVFLAETPEPKAGQRLTP